MLPGWLLFLLFLYMVVTALGPFFLFGISNRTRQTVLELRETNRLLRKQLGEPEPEAIDDPVEGLY